MNHNEDWLFDSMILDDDALAEFNSNDGASAVLVAVDEALLDVDVLQVAPTADRSRIIVMVSKQFMQDLWIQNDKDLKYVAEWVIKNGVMLADDYFSMNPQ